MLRLIQFLIDMCHNLYIKRYGEFGMITLDVPPQKQALLEQISKQAGVSIEQYINDLIDKYAKPQTQSNNMIERVKKMPKPTSYNPKRAVSIQRELRNEWN